MKLIHYIAGRPVAVEPTTLRGLSAIAVEPRETRNPRPDLRAEGGIKVSGPLERETSCIGDMEGWTSYADIAAAVMAAEADSNVSEVVLIIDSPGGDVAGCHELHTLIARCAKPTRAIIDGTGASAAYWLASACDRIEATSSAVVGSVGVYALVGGHDPEDGVTVTASLTPRKNALPDVDSQWQTLVDDHAELMLTDIAQARGIRGSLEAIALATGQGSIMSARRALALGLIDAITEGGASMPKNRTDIRAEAPAVVVAEDMPPAAPAAPAPGPTLEDLKAKKQALELELAGVDAQIKQMEKMGEPEAPKPAEPPPALPPEASAVAALAAATKAHAAELRESRLDLLVAQHKLAPGDRAVAAALYDGEQRGEHKLWTERYVQRADVAVPVGRQSHGQATAPEAQTGGTLHDRCTAWLAAQKMPNTPDNMRAAVAACARS